MGDRHGPLAVVRPDRLRGLWLSLRSAQLRGLSTARTGPRSSRRSVERNALAAQALGRSERPARRELGQLGGACFTGSRDHAGTLHRPADLAREIAAVDPAPTARARSMAV